MIEERLFTGRLLLYALLLCLFQGSIPVYAGTGFLPVPVTGNWHSVNKTIEVGGEVDLFLSLKPEITLGWLEVKIQLPGGLELVEGKLIHSFSDLSAGQFLHVPIRVRVNAPGEQQVIAGATIIEDKSLTLRKAFVLFINPAKREEPILEIIEGQEGKRYRVY